MPTAERPRRWPRGSRSVPPGPSEVEELLPLMRAYCDFYEAYPPDEGLRDDGAQR